MNKLSEFLTEGSITLNTVESPINGKLTVKWDTYGGYQIMSSDNLWQVGGPVENVWKSAFRKLPDDFAPKNILILGLGGGTIAKLVSKKWPSAKITGVDIDQVIVDLGKKYFGLGKYKVTTNIVDAFDFIESNKQKFDLICVDLYVGENYPEKFETEAFVNYLFNALNESGFVLVNRLYDGKKTSLAEKFRKKLATKFSTIKDLHLINESNVVYIASNQ